MQDDINPGAEVFAHRNNLRVGNGRILWGPATTDTSGNPHAEGYVLPGGRRTSDMATARAAALLIDVLAVKA